MSGAPILVTCYRNGIDSYGSWVTDPTAMTRIRELAAEGGEGLVGDFIWYEREPWTKTITKSWPAVDTFHVALELDKDHTPAGATSKAKVAAPKQSRKAKRGR